MQFVVLPAGTGKSRVLIALGLRAVERGLRVRYGTAADRVEQLYRDLPDNTVSRVIGGLLRNNLILINEFGLAPLEEYYETRPIHRLPKQAVAHCCQMRSRYNRGRAARSSSHSANSQGNSVAARDPLERSRTATCARAAPPSPPTGR